MAPYEKYRQSKFWKLIDRELAALEKNSDITITTAKDYVVGALVKKIVEAQTSEGSSKKLKR